MNDNANAIEFYFREEFYEGIPSALVNEVIRALPDASDTRKKLETWLGSNSRIEIPVSELTALQIELAEFAHKTQTELGEVGLLPQGVAGRLVDLSQFDGIPIYTVVVLAMALRRLTTLVGLGTKIFFIGQNVGGHK